MQWRYFKDSGCSSAWCSLSALVITLALGGLLSYIFIHGFRAISWDFLTLPPTDSMTKGGIMPAIVGTLYLTVGAIAIALPLGVVSAIYLTEYAKQGPVIRIIRIGVNCLAGVPSVVFGLFGLGFFVVFLQFGSSILSGALTLGILILPTIIGASEEALKSVPQTFREASLALGVSKWQTISRIVLPTALPGILTGSILGIGRAAGETAPIMFTAAAFFHGEAALVDLRRGHGPALPHLCPGHGRHAYRADPAHPVRNGPRACRPCPGHRSDCDHHPKRHPQEKKVVTVEDNRIIKAKNVNFYYGVIPGADRHHDGFRKKPGDRPDRTVGLRKIDAAAAAQPDERSD